MRHLVLRRRADERIRSQAHRVVSGCAPADDVCRMRRVLAYVAAVVPFERDPVDVEALSDPALMVERVAVHGSAPGDCDDAAILLAALLESIGIKSRFVAVSIRRDRVFHHVAVEGLDRRTGAYFMLDPYAPREVGRRPVFTSALRVAV